MKPKEAWWRWWLRNISLVMAGAVICSLLVGSIIGHATGAGPDTPAWPTPSVMTIKRVTDIPADQPTPNLFSNLDCTLLNYRLIASSAQQTGCFTETAFGLIDSDSDTVIFNGTDEGLPLYSSIPHQVLAPWPRSMELVALDPLSTGGTQISLYKNPLAHLQDQRNAFLQLASKTITNAPDLLLTDKLGQRLVINPQTLTFSDNGSWLVAETLNGSFVRLNLDTLEVKPFAPAFGSQGSPALLRSYLAVSRDGHYVAIANQDAGSFKVYDLTNCGPSSVNLEPEACQSYDYWPYAKSQISGLQSIKHVRFINNGLISFEAHSSNASQDGIYELAPRDKIDFLSDYLGLGDSFTSGEGAFDYLDGTDSATNSCHLSGKSYPLLLTQDLFSSSGGHSVACSGAVINDVANTSDNYRGQTTGGLGYADLQAKNPALLSSVMTNFIPGYVAQQRFVGQYQPAVLTVSVGGDDVGFGDIVERCVAPHVSLHLSDETCFNTYEDRLELTQLADRTVLRWISLFKQLKTEVPGGRVYAIGYPQIIDDTGNCALNVHLDKSEAEFANEFTDYLNARIRDAAGRAGIVYVDIGHALYGHRLCEAASSSMAVNGLTAGKDSGVLGVKMFAKESYHPTALGQQLIEAAILKQTHNLTDGVSIPDNSDDGQSILSAPQSGRAINQLGTGSAQPSMLAAGSQTSLKIDGAGAGLKVGQTYEVRLDGPGGAVISQVIPESDGGINSTVTIPGGTATGGHTVDVTGSGQTGDPVDVVTPISVGGGNDSDGDSIPNDADSCPTIINSGVDADQDGIDDACDGFIGAPQGSSSGQPTDSGQGQTAGQGTTSTSGGQTPPANSQGSGTSTETDTLPTTSSLDPAVTSMAANFGVIKTKSGGLSAKTPPAAQTKNKHAATAGRISASAKAPLKFVVASDFDWFWLLLIIWSVLVAVIYLWQERNDAGQIEQNAALNTA